jgi:hypothetical protein
MSPIGAAGDERRHSGWWKGSIMAYMLEIAIVDGGDETIKVVHQFFGHTEREVETYKREHLASCEYFRAAEHDDRTIENLEVIGADELPTPEDYDDDDEDDVA